MYLVSFNSNTLTTVNTCELINIAFYTAENNMWLTFHNTKVTANINYWITAY
jgi:hypothetical protein